MPNQIQYGNGQFAIHVGLDETAGTTDALLPEAKGTQPATVLKISIHGFNADNRFPHDVRNQRRNPVVLSN
jgi:hypothetical protein